MELLVEGGTVLTMGQGGTIRDGALAIELSLIHISEPTRPY